jgi:CRISPR-associated exonuclease Cas4
LRTEEAEKKDENVRLLYVACTRAMELLVIPDFTWSNDASWAKLLDFKFDTIPDLDIGRFARSPIALQPPAVNLQSAKVFAEERSRIEGAPRVRWITPSDGDRDVITARLSPDAGEDEPLRPAAAIEGGRIRGILLHKVMEELISGEIEEDAAVVTNRSAELLAQLVSMSPTGATIDASEIAATALRTLRLPDIVRYRRRLVAEVPIYAAASADDLISGRADAVARDDEGSVVFDWKSDVAPKDAEFAAYRNQLGQYLRAIGAHKGAIVYMTTGQVDWIGLT